jgi:hypothetical protein
MHLLLKKRRLERSARQQSQLLNWRINRRSRLSLKQLKKMSLSLKRLKMLLLRKPKSVIKRLLKKRASERFSLHFN